MKIKGRVKNLAPSASILIMAVAALISVPLRTYQIVNIIEAETGFFLRHDVSIAILYAVLICACGLIIVFSYLSGAMPKPELAEKKSALLGIATLLFTVSLLFDSVMQIDNFTQLYNEYANSVTRGYEYFVKSGAVSSAFQSLFGLLSAVYFSMVSASFFKGKRFYEANRLLALSPIIWGLSRIIQRYIEPISFKNVSELMMQMFMLVFLLIFFLSFARIASGVNSEKSSWALFSCGLCASLLAITSAGSAIVVMIMGKSSLLYSEFPVTFADFFAAVFIILLLLDFMPTKLGIEQMNRSEIELVEESQADSEEVK